MRLAARPVRLSSHSKYRAVATVVDGIRFASKREAARYSELKLLDRAGAISNLRLQPRFPLRVQPIEHDKDSVFIGTYVADFSYVVPGGIEEVIEDVKGVRTPLYKLKKKMAEALYGIVIREIR